LALLRGQYLERIYGGEGGWRERGAKKDGMGRARYVRWEYVRWEYALGNTKGGMVRNPNEGIRLIPPTCAPVT